MRLFEIAHPSRPTAHQKWLSTVTVFVQEAEWDILQTILSQMGPTEVTAVRPLCRFGGMSVDVLCQSPDAASDLIGKFYDLTFKKVHQSGVVRQAERARAQR
jgi:hypothetical protein